MYPEGVLAGSIALSVAFFILAFYFRNDLKKVVGFRLASIAFFATAIFTVGLIFNGHFILKNLPIVIPLIGIGSYSVSYFLSFYLIKNSYRSSQISDKRILIYISKISRKLKIKPPKLYQFISKEPRAFLVDGYRKAIFLSNTLLKELDFASLKAVILHELYHLKRRSGMFKNLANALGNLNFRILPVPIEELEQIEEKEIDKILEKNHGINLNEVRKKLYGKKRS